MPQFKFIAVEGNGGERTDLRKSVRSHAIRTGLRKRTSFSRAKTSEATMSGSIEPVRGLLGLVERTPTKSRTHMNKSVSSGSVDPFNSLPIPTNLQIDFLVKYFLVKFGSYSAGVDRSKSWFSYSLQSAPMMHSTLALTAVLWRAEYPGLQLSVQVEGIRQKGEAIREIQAQLGEASWVYDLGDMNFLMSTMSTLAIAGVCDGDFEAAEAHVRGVYVFVNSRGGRGNFDEEFVLGKSVDLADIQVAIALGRLPLFTPLRREEAHLPEYNIAQGRSQSFHRCLDTNGSGDHSRIFTHVRQLLLAEQSKEVLPETLGIHLNDVDSAVLQYLYQHTEEGFGASGLFRALVQAAHIFIYVTLRRVPPSSPLINRMCIRLRDTVETISTDGENWAENKEALLWIAFVGLLGIGEKIELCLEKQYFLNLLRSSKQGHLDDFPQEASAIRKTLSLFLWDEAYCQPLLEDLQNCPEG